MRTTLTLDDDVAAMLERLRAARDESLKDLVNDALRRGLREMSSSRGKRREPFRTSVVSLGRCRLDNIDNVAEVLELSERSGLP